MDGSMLVRGMYVGGFDAGQRNVYLDGFDAGQRNVYVDGFVDAGQRIS